jgi:hypothetical protein
MRRIAVAALTASFVPLVVGAVAVRPAAAVTATGYEQYSMTAVASGVRTGGDVGASGGLVTLDTGSAYVSARLDASPSAGVLADPYEPGTLARTAAGQVNAGAGDEVVDVPDAEAQYPGDGKGSLETVPPTSNPPLSTGGGSATAQASEFLAEGTATGAATAVTGAYDAGSSTSAARLHVDPAKGVVTATARTNVKRIVFAGVLELRDVVASASITTAGDKHVSLATLTVGGASVSGQQVAIDENGVHAVGTPLVPGQTIQDATKQANAVLSGAGVTVHATEAVRTTTSRSAAADTGGLVVTLATPDLPGGVAANHLQVVVGGVSLTETDAPPVALGLPLDTPPLSSGPLDTPPVTTTTVIPGTQGTGTALGPAQAPTVAPATAPASFLVAGRRLSAAATLAAFAVWQFLTLGTATLYAVVDRRRRVAARLVAA